MRVLGQSHRLSLSTAIAMPLAALILAGCSPTLDSSESGANNANTDDLAAQMVGCLKAGGVPARIDDTAGMVMVQATSGLTIEDEGDGQLTVTSEASSDGSPADSSPLLIADVDADTGLAWMAFPNSEALSSDPEVQQVYKECEAKHPDFKQPEFNIEDSKEFQEFQAQAQEDGLEFARCSRDAGYEWVSDPEQAGVILVPEGVTESEVRGAIDACYKPEYSLSWGGSGDLDLGSIMRDLPSPNASGLSKGASELQDQE